MVYEWAASRLGAGVNQSGVPVVPRQYGAKANGLMVRGVVTATYVLDDESHPQSDVGASPTAVYCDVLVYSSMRNMRSRFVKTVLVAQERSGLHSGHIWKPRPATFDVATENTFDPERGTNPASMDGDHVLIGFMDDNLNQPIILRSIPHPSADLGNDDKPIGHRIKLKVVDGDPDFWKHHGSVYGVEDNGNFMVDTRFAHDGVFQEDGTEKPPPTDGSGSQFFDLQNAATHGITFYDMSDPDNPEPKFLLRMEGPDGGFKWEVEFVDDATKVTYEKDKATIDVKGTTKFLVEDGVVTALTDKFVVKGENDKLITESRMNTELGKISDEIGTLSKEGHTHPGMGLTGGGTLGPIEGNTGPDSGAGSYSPGDIASTIGFIDD